ncbi:MAG: hypothetical protein A3K68_04675 [Euryarchaeota archaeon RBG_16_68_13]|nr:MAG: hypothetical protein A3K68_04675 [Euryarchaeota archaeon RBG_16_68_13]
MRIIVRDLRRDEEGVASTVGTIMALLVFLTFLSLIVNQYVPVWMKDSESAHMNSALGQFGSLKGAIDLQVLAAQMAQSVGLNYIPVTSSNAITLGLDGVPIFSAPTLGEMAVSPDAGGWTVTFYYDIRGVTTKVTEAANGTIDLNVGNRYFIPQQIAYENGAVIKAQIDGQTIRAQPVFEPVKVNNTLDFTFQLISLYGRGSVTGTTTEVVNTKLFGLDRQDYEDVTSTVWINHTSRYGLAWYNFFNATLARSLTVTSGTYQRALSQGALLYIEFIGRVSGTDLYKVRADYSPSASRYLVTLEIYNTGLLPLGVFRLQHAYVTVGVGEATEELPL